MKFVSKDKQDGLKMLEDVYSKGKNCLRLIFSNIPRQLKIVVANVL